MAKINFVDTRYTNAVAQLEGCVGQLEEIVSEYRSLNNRVEQCYDSEQTKELQRLIQANVDNINQSIGATKVNIEQFTIINENAIKTNNAVGDILTEAADTAAALFGN